MTQKVADQHALLERGWATASDLYVLLAELIHVPSVQDTVSIGLVDECLASLRRYEDARHS